MGNEINMNELFYRINELVIASSTPEDWERVEETILVSIAVPKEVKTIFKEVQEFVVTQGLSPALIETSIFTSWIIYGIHTMAATIKDQKDKNENQD